MRFCHLSFILCFLLSFFPHKIFAQDSIVSQGAMVSESSVVFQSTVASQGNWWLSVLSDSPIEQVKQTLKQDGAWYECDAELDVDTYCLDAFSYYHQRWYGEMSIREHEVQLSFMMAYQAQNLSDAILNLRKDGFVISHVKIADERFDVISSLKEKEPEMVDKALIMFINRYSQNEPRTINWVLASEFDSVKPRLNVVLRSDGELIHLDVIRF
ncbi:hypothetical protein [Vibrio sp. B1REV9]|uniref:hypothetical protein n=1 Tax=Vibrio sp. B1REV9 TaxID=2751179 RepID=UPI001CC780E9|nr:hypothetical protein [Vibrio sp. B1REV9]